MSGAMNPEEDKSTDVSGAQAQAQPQPQLQSLQEASDDKTRPETIPETTPPTAITATTANNTEPEFKEGGYGWIIVLCVFLINAHTWGLNSSYAVFLAYYLDSGAFSGASPIAFAFVGGLSFSISLLISPLATISIRVWGTKPTLGLGVIIESVSLVAASFSTKIWHLLLTQGIVFGIGMGLLFNSTVGIVPQYFVRRRSFAVALSTSGSGLGGLVYSLATNAIIDRLGLEWAFRILAILSFTINGICCLLFRDRNRAIGSVLNAFHWELLKRAEFWLFLAWGFMSMIGYVIMLFSLPDYASTVGMTAQQGSILSAMMNLSQGIGRPLIGLASDRYGRINVCTISTLIAGLSALAIWLPAGQYYPGTIVYALFGAFAGSLWPTVSTVGVEVIGIQLLPSGLSIMWFILVIPTTFAQPIALAIKGSGPKAYLGVQILTALAFIAAFLPMWVLRSWKVNQLDNESSTTTQSQPEADRVLDRSHQTPIQQPQKLDRAARLRKGLFSKQHV